jgi:hypothetical protein
MLAGVIALVAIAALWGASARATTFDFTDEYYFSEPGQNGCNTTQWRAAFGSGAGACPHQSGIYQETNTNTANPTIVRLASSGAPGEFVQNTVPNASKGLQLFGWGASLNNATSLANNIYNVANPFNGSVLYFRYETNVTGDLFSNGTTTAFDFNAITFKGALGQTFTLDAYLGGVLQDRIVLTGTGGFTTYTENWANVDTVAFDNTVANPINCTGCIYLGSIGINDPMPRVPEPMSMALLGAGLIGLGVVRRMRG